jgi:hypothetical protein
MNVNSFSLLYFLVSIRKLYLKHFFPHLEMSKAMSCVGCCGDHGDYRCGGRCYCAHTQKHNNYSKRVKLILGHICDNDSCDALVTFSDLANEWMQYAASVFEGSTQG